MNTYTFTLEFEVDKDLEIKADTNEEALEIVREMGRRIASDLDALPDFKVVEHY